MAGKRCMRMLLTVFLMSVVGLGGWSMPVPALAQETDTTLRNSPRMRADIRENVRAERRRRLRSDNVTRCHPGCRACRLRNYGYSVELNGGFWRKKPTVIVRKVSNSKPGSSSNSGRNTSASGLSEQQPQPPPGQQPAQR